MDFEICQLDAGRNVDLRSIYWLVQAISSFSNSVQELGAQNLSRNLPNSFAYYADPASYSTKGYDTNFVFDDSVLTSNDNTNIGNPAALGSFCRKYGLLKEGDNIFELSEIGGKVLDKEITVDEYAFILLSKQWIRVNKKCNRSLLSIIYELFSNGNSLLQLLENESQNRKKLREIFFTTVCKGQTLSNDVKFNFARFDILINALLYSGLLSKHHDKLVCKPESLTVLKSFFENEDKLSKYEGRGDDFYRYMSSYKTGALEVIDSNNISSFAKLYPNLVKSVSIVFTKDNNAVINCNQRIYYGAPGTGKSFTVREKYEKGKDEKYIFRTTFHPDMDYSMFVGCYKPKTQRIYLLDGKNLSQDELLQVFKDSANYTNEKKARYLYEGLVNAVDIKKMGLNGQNIADLLIADGFTSGAYTSELDNMVKAHDWLEREGYLSESNISYEFVPQTFTDAYVAAWKDLKNKYYLIIEEINRGNCAQIFGDLFQLLDRDKKTGRSSYRIKADNDLRDYLKEQLPEESYGIADDKLCLPPNLSIIATMNTSDQSLFPMDSAFKRRWEWEYVPIQYEKEFTIDKEKKVNRSYYFNFCIGGQKYSWIKFIKLVNDKIFELTEAEDKKIGNYFVDLPEDENIIDEPTFINKVMFYLWNDVCKDEKGNTKNFYRTQEKEFSFNELFEEERQHLLIGFLENLEGDLTPISKSNPHENSASYDGTSADIIPESDSEIEETKIQSDTTQGPEVPIEGNPEEDN